jgi:hypothetical protein
MVCFFLFFDWGCFVSLLCLSQRAWLLKLLAVELHAGDVSSSNHRDTCQTILSNLFGQGTTGIDEDQAIYPFSLQDNSENADFRTVSKSKVMIVINCFMFPFLLWSYFLVLAHAYIGFYIVYYKLHALPSMKKRVDKITSKYLLVN